MQARRFWPHIKHKLFYTNLVVYGIIVVVLVAFNHELMWAQKIFRAYAFTNNIPASKDYLLIGEATKNISAGEDIQNIQPLIEQALEINPYSEARFLLGNCYLIRGDEDTMLDYYEQYLKINPSVSGIYVNMIRILMKKGDYDAINQLVTEGIANFRRRVELYRPHEDPNVREEFNLKALKIYNNAHVGLKRLRKIQAKLDKTK